MGKFQTVGDNVGTPFYVNSAEGFLSSDFDAIKFYLYSYNRDATGPISNT